MASNLSRKILRTHLAEPSDMIPGEEISLKIDQTLTHDINAVMTFLAFERIGVDRTQVDTSVSYLDHNLLYMDFKTPDDHIYLQSVARKYGIYVSRPGNGICHAIQIARFGAPGKLSLGGDSHTPHGGAIGMMSIGAGGMDIAVAMTGIPIRIKMPKIVKVELRGRLRPGCGSKDIILEMLRRTGVKGGLGKIYEYVGPGVETLEVSDRVTIANMGTEMGATSSIFPADEMVRKFMKSQDRENEFIALTPDEGCGYDEEMEIDLSSLEPLVACPHQPDNVTTMRELEKKKVQQVMIGSCTNGSYKDIAKVATILKGHHVNEDVSCTLAVSSKQIYKRLMKDGYIDMLLDAGVRLLELACGPCCAIGQSPATDGIAVRTTNRNFKGRSGNPTAQVYLVSPETAAACAITGTFSTASEIMGERIYELDAITEPESYPIDDSQLIPPLPPEEAAEVEIIRGPNIAPLPVPDVPADHLECAVSLKAVDNITTDDITPASAEFSSMRSNIPLMSRYCYTRYDPEFSERARELGKSIIVAGENYGQGSSREHAAINPMYLGVKAVIAKSVARIHAGNLVNHGIVPMIFEDPADYDRIDQMDMLEIDGFRRQIKEREVTVWDRTKDFAFKVRLELTDSEMDVILSGGRLRYLQNELRERGVIKDTDE